jgi:hypothetical protein
MLTRCQEYPYPSEDFPMTESTTQQKQILDLIGKASHYRLNSLYHLLQMSDQELAELEAVLRKITEMP